MRDPAGLLSAYDGQLRGSAECDAGAQSDRDGPLVRVHYPRRGFVSYRTLEGIDAAELDELIARQIEHFAARGEAFEWKTRGHDKPVDLPQRLRAAGFVPEDPETVLIGVTADLATDPALPEGVSLRAVIHDADLHRIAGLESAVWAADRSWLADDLRQRIAAAPDEIEILVADTDHVVVSAAWLVYKPGTDFAGLWGGATLAGWRGRGIYRALVARRAQLAVARGVKYLQVDASDNSRPILERLGFVAVTTTTPYVWTPPAATTTTLGP
jgi:GNAT superfamily N-acetyltransferase